MSRRNPGIVKYLLAMGVGVVILQPVSAQYRGELFQPRFGLAEWRTIHVGMTIPQIDGESDTFGPDRWSSSYLVPDDPAPEYPRTEATTSGEDDSELAAIDDHSEAIARWAFKYSARSLADRNPATGWSEGVEGDGVGEVVLAKVDTRRPVFVRNGFQMSKELFLANNRVKRVRVFLLQAGKRMPNQFDSPYAEVKVLAAVDAELSDTMGFQRLPVPPNAIEPMTEWDGSVTDPPQYASFVALQILSVYPGTRYHDTCLSDVYNLE
ncbi:MAG TPA: hypothetical protein VMW87_07485 [Spirochaetia bacterium]|nr:hypothetical protein [Spirochaetia bacterium]